MEAPYKIIRHAYAGCDSGCCGYHSILVEPNGEETYLDFVYDHPDIWDPVRKVYVRDVDGDEAWGTIIREFARGSLGVEDLNLEESEISYSD